MFLSGQNNNFRFHFPKVFVPDEIEEKYSPLLKRIPGCMCETIVDFINYSIKSIELNLGVSQEVIEQIDRGTPYKRSSRSDAYPDMLWNRDMTINFQLDSMYLMWFILCEIYMYYYCTKEKYIPKPPGMEILDAYHKVVYRVEFTNLIFKEVSGLQFDFSENTIDQKVISTTWRANKVTPKIEPSKA